MPLSSLDISDTGGQGDIDKVKNNQGEATVGKIIDQPQRDGFDLEVGVRDRRYMTNMVRLITGATKDQAECERETVRSGNIKINHKDQAEGTPPSTLYGNIVYLDGTPVNIHMGGGIEVWKGDLLDRSSGYELMTWWGND